MSLNRHDSTGRITLISGPISQMRKLRHRRRGVGAETRAQSATAEPLPAQLSDPGHCSPLTGPHPTQGGRQLPCLLGLPPPRKTLRVERAQGAPESRPAADGYSQKAEDNGARKGDEQEEGQGAQDGRDNDHAPTPPAWPRVDRRVRGG